MPPSDAVRRLSDVLARDPGSPVALELAELLAARGDVGAARRVAARAAARHPLRADAHELAARLAMRAEDWRDAHEAWCRVLALSAADAERRAEAWLGQAFVAFREERMADAERALREAEAEGASAEAIATARARLHDAASPEPELEAGALDAPTADAHALVVAAEQAVRHLGLGAWRRVVVEAAGWHLAVVPAGRGLAIRAAPPDVPLGRTLRRLEVAARAAAGEDAS